MDAFALDYAEAIGPSKRAYAASLPKVIPGFGHYATGTAGIGHLIVYTIELSTAASTGCGGV